jgi:hypothetical protein
MVLALTQLTVLFSHRCQPIQRMCKYPLLFDDLCRHTPVYDDPETHAELEKALFRLQETIREVNKAKDDPKTRRLIEITWQLQDRLAFQEQVRIHAIKYCTLLSDLDILSSSCLSIARPRPCLWRVTRRLPDPRAPQRPVHGLRFVQIMSGACHGQSVPDTLQCRRIYCACQRKHR